MTVVSLMVLAANKNTQLLGYFIPPFFRRHLVKVSFPFFTLLSIPLFFLFNRVLFFSSSRFFSLLRAREYLTLQMMESEKERISSNKRKQNRRWSSHSWSDSHRVGFFLFLCAERASPGTRDDYISCDDWFCVCSYREGSFEIKSLIV